MQSIDAAQRFGRNHCQAAIMQRQSLQFVQSEKGVHINTGDTVVGENPAEWKQSQQSQQPLYYQSVNGNNDFIALINCFIAQIFA